MLEKNNLSIYYLDEELLKLSNNKDIKEVRNIRAQQLNLMEKENLNFIDFEFNNYSLRLYKQNEEMSVEDDFESASLDIKTTYGLKDLMRCPNTKSKSKLELLNDKYKNMEFNDQTGKNKVLRVWRPDGSRIIYVEHQNDKNDCVYGMVLEDFERTLRIYN